MDEPRSGRGDAGQRCGVVLVALARPAVAEGRDIGPDPAPRRASRRLRRRHRAPPRRPDRGRLPHRAAQLLLSRPARQRVGNHRQAYRRAFRSLWRGLTGMRLVIAMMKHETNTFSPIRTDWQRFLDWGAHLGEDARRAYEGTGMPMAAYLDLAKSIGAEIATPVAAEAMPSGPVTEDAYERMTGAILDAVAKGCDAIMLDLHGAMVAETTPDGEGTLLERIRAIARGLPIAVTCDLHANLSDKMVQNCTALIGYKTYPHVDMYAVGKQVGAILLGAMAGRLRPVMAWGRRPLLAQTLRMGTDDEPMKSLIAMARDAEAHGLLAITMFGGFPLADTPASGLSAISIADGDAAAARRATEALLDAAWTRRDDFLYRHEPLEHAVARAKAAAEGASRPVLLLDHADNVGSGGTEDVMTVIREVIRQGLDDVAVGAVCDPAAVTAMQKAGVGATVTLALGGRTDMASIRLARAPL